MERNLKTRFSLVVCALAAIGSAYGQNSATTALMVSGNALVLRQAVSAPATSLTKEEREGLLFMREEEKLALDVYVVLAKRWGSRPFGNIAQAEQTHMSAVKGLLDQYGLPDPSANLKPGKFNNKELQKMHDDLVRTGSLSRTEALKVGATIEDMDLFDLARWAKLTDKPDILAFYERLAAGSRNHLRAFTRNLRNAGITYKPRFINQDSYDKIVGSGPERGGTGGRTD